MCNFHSVLCLYDMVEICKLNIIHVRALCTTSIYNIYTTIYRLYIYIYVYMACCSEFTEGGKFIIARRVVVFFGLVPHLQHTHTHTHEAFDFATRALSLCVHPPPTRGFIYIYCIYIYRVCAHIIYAQKFIHSPVHSYPKNKIPSPRSRTVCACCTDWHQHNAISSSFDQHSRETHIAATAAQPSSERTSSKYITIPEYIYSTKKMAAVVKVKLILLN